MEERKIPMNSLERRILIELLMDAERTAVSIAERVGSSRQTVSKKIDKFEDSGVIEGVSARVDPSRVGLEERAFVFIQEDPEMSVRRKIEREIDRIPQVTRFFRLFGRYSGLLEILTRDQQELSSLVKEIHELEGMRETETFIVHSSVKNRPQDALIHALREDAGH